MIPLLRKFSDIMVIKAINSLGYIENFDIFDSQAELLSIGAYHFLFILVESCHTVSAINGASITFAWVT